MKKFVVSFVAVAIAIIGFSFSPKDFSEGPQCNISVYWFKVKPTVTKTSCNLVIQGDLETIPDLNNNSAIDVTDGGEFGTPAISPFGCEDLNDQVCALGYIYNPGQPDNQVERVLKSGSSTEYEFRPISGQVSSFRCCVKRPIEE